MPDIIPQQVLVPQKIYIGDSAELHCTFEINDSVLKEKVSSGIIEIPVSSLTVQPDINDCVINKIQLMSAGVDHYQVIITFVPWKTGTLQMPAITIEDIQLLLQPVQVVSITQQNNATILKESLSPLLLPGTTYKLYGALIALIIFIIAAIELIIKRKNVAFFLKTKALQRKYRKNKKQLIKKLHSLSDEKESAGKIQQLLRSYLEIRFDFPFTKAVTSELMNDFITITQNLLGDEKNDAFAEIVNVFIRTDFIRYSENGKFDENELNLMIEKIITNIEILEGGYETNA